MKILIISIFFPPLNSIASLRPHSWAKYWSQAGHDVTVLTTEKSKNSDVQLNLSNEGFKTVEVPYPHWIAHLRQDYQASQQGGGKPKNIFKRWITDLFHYLRFEKGILHSCRMPDITDLWVKKAYETIKSQGPWDLVISTAGPYTTHLVAHKLKKNHLTKQWIADYRDPWSHSCIYPGIFPFNKIEKVLEKKILRYADKITTISAPFAQMFAEIFAHPSVHVIENGFDPDDLLGIEKELIFPNDGKFRLVHTGSIYKGRRDPTPLFEALQEMEESDKNHLEVIFVGSNQADLQELIKQFNLEKWVKVLGFIKREDALRMQRDAHALLFLPWKDASVDGVLTGKLFEYLFSGTPIIAVGATGLEDSQRLIIGSQAGEALLSVKEIKNYLLGRLKNNKKIPSGLSLQSLAKYTRKYQAEKLLGLIF